MELTFQVATFFKHFINAGNISCEQVETMCAFGTHIFEICGDRPSFASLKVLTVASRKALLSTYLNRSVSEIDFSWDAVRIRSHSFQSLLSYVQRPSASHEINQTVDLLRTCINLGVPHQITNVLADCALQIHEISCVQAQFLSSRPTDTAVRNP